MKLLAVEPDQVNARNVINVTFQNPTAAYLNSFCLINDVTKKGQNDSRYSSDTSGMQMAPNSHFSYPISLEGQKLEAGTYLLNLLPTAEKAMKDSIKSRMVMRKKDIYTDGNLKRVYSGWRCCARPQSERCHYRRRSYVAIFIDWTPLGDHCISDCLASSEKE